MSFQDNITISQAYERYNKMLTRPMLAIMFSGLAIGFSLLFITNELWGLLFVVVGFFLGIGWYICSFWRWFVWAMANVATPKLLYHRLLRSGVLYPQGSLLNKVYPRIGVTQQVLNHCWQLTSNDGDLLSLGYLVPEDGIVYIGYSKKQFWENVAGAIFFLCTPIVFYLVGVATKPLIFLSICFYLPVIFMGKDIYKFWKIKDQHPLVFSRETLTISTEIIPWSCVKGWLIFHSSRNQISVYYDILVVDPVTLNEEVKRFGYALPNLLCSADTIDEYFTIYHKLAEHQP